MDYGTTNLQIIRLSLLNFNVGNLKAPSKACYHMINFTMLLCGALLAILEMILEYLAYQTLNQLIQRLQNIFIRPLPKTRPITLHGIFRSFQSMYIQYMNAHSESCEIARHGIGQSFDYFAVPPSPLQALCRKDPAFEATLTTSKGKFPPFCAEKLQRKPPPLQ